MVTAVLVEGRSKAEVARSYGLSRPWVHELVRRYLAEGDAGLEPRSRRPHTSPKRITASLEDEIVALRKDLVDHGLDAGAHTIAFHLAQRSADVPSVSTIWRILCRRGFVTPQPQKRPKSSFIRFEAAMPNERWQADITHWHLADGTDVEILNILDDHSRFLVGSDAARVFKAADVVASFHRAAAANGFPASLLTDNGAVFTAAPRGGRCALELECDRLGIKDVHSRAYHPQTCGKVERFHQTLKRWLDNHDPAVSVHELQVMLEEFRIYYNEVRPHRALERMTPAEAYAARPKATPSGPIVQAPFRLRHDRIDGAGAVTLRHDSRLHHIKVGRRFAGTRVLMLVAGLDVRIVNEDGELLRAFTLDPTTGYQGLGKR
ncbi:MAG: IS481 family transposase [Actinomycetes bacterium]